MSKDFEVRRITTDVLIIGGGTAGCYAALTLSRDTELSIVIAEKAHIKRSGCLAAGVNAINAYITKGHVPQDYVDYAKKDAAGIVREDLLLTAAEHFNEVTADMEQLGLVILKDENGEYVTRGNRNIKINGENFKPILAKAVQAQGNVSILNRVNITKLLTKGGAVYGAVGFSLEDEEAYVIEAKAVLVATGGAAGLYKPGFSRHKMWYPPFNTGAGYAMGIQAGAEMTSFEMRFIALRCKDTIAPTGTIAQGVGARQVNSRGFVYEDKYGLTTSERVYGTVKENQQGNGPCYLQTSGIDKEQEENLLKAYLNMAPSQTLKWIETGELPGEQDVEIEGTEPYIVGGGCPQKYVTGALAEGELAAKAIEAQLIGNAKVSDEKAGSFENDLAKKAGSSQEKIKKYIEAEAGQEIDAYRHILSEHKSSFTAEELEEAMQKVMDEYAGGISTHYQYNEKQLKLADEKIDQLIALADQLAAENMHELLFVYELKERLIVCKSLIAHLRGRKETRWHSFNENLDYPEKDDVHWRKYVNSKLENGELKIIFRDLVEGGQTYEHCH